MLLLTAKISGSRNMVVPIVVEEGSVYGSEKGCFDIRLGLPRGMSVCKVIVYRVDQTADHCR